MTEQKIAPCLWFDFNAEEAVAHYLSIFPNSRIISTTRYGEFAPGRNGAVMTILFEIDGQRLLALNSVDQVREVGLALRAFLLLVAPRLCGLRVDPRHVLEHVSAVAERRVSFPDERERVAGELVEGGPVRGGDLVSRGRSVGRRQRDGDAVGR